MSARSFLDTDVRLQPGDTATRPRSNNASWTWCPTCGARAPGSSRCRSCRSTSSARRGSSGWTRRWPAGSWSFFARFEVVQLGVDDVLASVDLHRLHGVAFWDALVLRAAGRGDCSVLYSEDLQHGRSYDGVRVLNPFR